MKTRSKAKSKGMGAKPSRRRVPTQPAPAEPTIPVVGIGASAGGLEALSELLGALPPDTGMAFVLVQHLDPHHESALASLLARTTSLPVSEVANNEKVEPNHVYVIPPNTVLSLDHGLLTLAPRSASRAPPRSIDLFFESLAADRKERAIGVILSGTASDGTAGLEAIKAEGGITFAQDDSARYESMPQSAVAAGCVDLVLPPAKIAREIARIARHPHLSWPVSETAGAESEGAAAARASATKEAAPARGTPPSTRAGGGRSRAGRGGRVDAESGFERVLALLGGHGGVDFSLYKPATLRRRITRRMALGKHETIGAYARALRGQSTELDALLADALIGVTSFFRNPEAFDVLARTVFPKILQQKVGDTLRAWVIGCSSGQEAYSIAITFAELAAQGRHPKKLQVFATDLNESSLEKARRGFYPRSIANELTPERLRRFFVEEQGGYRVAKTLRETVVFARQNVLGDPPFSHLDLVSCRNLLIYLEPSVHRKLFPLFHYALDPGGFLMLGTSESVGGFTDLFETVDKKQKVFQRKPALLAPALLPIRAAGGDRYARRSLALSLRRNEKEEVKRAAPPPGAQGDLAAQREADRVTVQRLAPPGVLVDADFQVVQFRGATADFLEPASGRASFDVLKMSREGLMLPLRAALREAKTKNRAARRDNVRIVRGRRSSTVALEVVPLKNLSERSYLILFRESADAAPALEPSAAADGGGRKRKPAAGAAQRENERRRDRQRQRELELELAEARDFARALQEQHEAAHEELQSSTEEVQSANEELQSLNEELQTSKEELESAYEELVTVNEELSSRNAELDRLNSDLVNVETSTRLSIVLLGRDLTIRRFSAQAAKQLGLGATDIGRPFGSVKHGLGASGFDALIADAIDSVRERECETRDRGGCWVSVRVRPYLTADARVDGAVVVLVDVDAMKRAELAAAAARDYADNLVETLREPLLVLDPELRVERANRAYYRAFQVTPEETLGKRFFELGDRQWDGPDLRERLERVLPDDAPIEDFEVDRDVGRLGRRTMVLNARRVQDGGGSAPRILFAVDDVTERRRARERLREIDQRFSRFMQFLPGPAWIKDEAGRYLFANSAAEGAFRAGAGGIVGKTDRDLFPPERAAEFERSDRRVLAGEASVHTMRSIEEGDNKVHHALVSKFSIPVADGQAVQVGGIAIDISELREAEEAVRRSEARFRTLAEALPGIIWRLDPAGRVSYVNPQFLEYSGKSSDQVLGDSWSALLHPEDAPRYLAAISRAQSERARMHASVRVQNRAGEWRWLDSTALPEFDVEGGYLGHVGVSLDVTELRDSAKALAEADLKKNEFLAMLGHELRNPLAPMRSWLEILRRVVRDDAMKATVARGGGEPSLGPIVAQATEAVSRQLEQMIRLVDDLLDIGRITSGKIELRPERVTLSAIVDAAVETVAPLFEQEGRELQVTLPPDAVWLDADLARLVQVMSNLLHNAVKYTERGGHVWLDAEVDASTAPVVVVRVRDDGIGVAADELPHIFEMFHQVDTSKAGLGVGLTLVKSLVERHGGSIEARSEGIGLGTEVVVRLPLVERALRTATPGGARERTAEPAPGAGVESGSADGAERVPADAPLRILVVDDNSDSADSIALLLRLGGHETHTAYDGLAALEAAQRLRPDALVLDLGLPGLSGLEVAERVRASRELEPTVLIAVSGRGQADDHQRSRAAGFDLHLVKPVEPALLSRRLRELCAARRRAPAS